MDLSGVIGISLAMFGMYQVRWFSLYQKIAGCSAGRRGRCIVGSWEKATWFGGPDLNCWTS